MKIEIRNLKFSQLASEETHCFAATIYIDDKRAGTARNAGHGGPTDIDPRACLEGLNAHAATLPKVVTDIKDEKDPTGFFTYDPTGESLVNDLVDEALTERDLKKALAKRVLFTRAGNTSIFETKALKADILARTLKDPALVEKLRADKVLNLMPLADALVVYKAGANPGES
jgi:hypothetical protein